MKGAGRQRIELVLVTQPKFNLGKTIPSVGPFRNFKVNVIGPGPIGKFAKLAKAIISAEGLTGLIAGTAIGTGVALDGSIQTDEESNQFTKARSAIVSNKYRFRSNPKSGNLYRRRYTRHVCGNRGRSRCCC